MRRNLFHYGFTIFFVMAFFFSSCKKENEKPVFPLSATIFKSVSEKQVAFTALTHSAISWSWDFGDGKTSTEQNPIHIYDVGGYYKAKLTATDAGGNTASSEVSLAIALTPYALLTGDNTEENYKGKTWKLTTNHTTNTDYLANCDAALSVVSGTPKPLPTGIFSSEFKMDDVYKDEFTFYHDGSYKHNNSKIGGSSFSALLNQMVINGGKSITNDGGKKYGMCMAKYTPEADAKFTFVEKEDLTVTSVYGSGGKLTFKDVSTLDFTGTEFVGFRDVQRKIILNKITDTSMQLIMFMAASDKNIGINTNALILSFEVVK